MNELYRGVLLGIGLSLIFVSLIFRGFVALATSHGRQDPVTQTLAWILVLPFIGLGFYFVGLGATGT